MKYACQGCQTTFTKKYNFIRHINSKTPCMDDKELFLNMFIKLQQEMSQIQKKNRIQDKEIQILKKEISSLKNKPLIINNSTYNSDHSVTNIDNSTNIKIVNFGDEDLSEILTILKNNPKEVITDSSPESLVNCLAIIHCSETSTQNHNIKFDETMSKSGLRIHQNGTWNLKKPKYVIKNTGICQKVEDLYDSDPEGCLNLNADLRTLIKLNSLNRTPMTSIKKKNINSAAKKLLNYFKSNEI